MSDERHPDDAEWVPTDEGRTPLRCECGRQIRLNWVVQYPVVPVFADGVRQEDLNRSYMTESAHTNLSRGCPCGKAYFLRVDAHDEMTYKPTAFSLGSAIEPMGHWKQDFGEEEEDDGQ
jgi:hypothetical protein